MKTAIIGIGLIVLLIAVPATFYLFVSVPADVSYGNKFGAYVALAVSGPPDFAGIKVNVLTFYANMNQTWPDKSTWSTTYNSPWPWDKTYDNSISAENQYLHHLLNRIAYYQQQVNKTGVAPLTDIYDQYIKNLRAEIQSTGNLDWVVHNAYYLGVAPLAYWGWLYVFIIEIVLLFLLLILIMASED